jgi:choline dehydrogenase-like flavoprotein
MTEYTADVVIVGGGVAGLLAAVSLRRAGVDVLVLEAGPRVNRADALATFRDAVAKTPESPYPVVPYSPHPTVLSLEDGYYLQEGPVLFGSTYTRRLGGSTWHWLGTTLRHLPADLQLQSRYGVAVDWPIGYDDLQSWYGAAERELGVAGDESVDLGSPREGPYPLPPLPLTYLDVQLSLAFAPLGIEVKLTPQARNSVFHDNRPPCCGNATCVPICPIGAKYDATRHAEKFEFLGGRILVEAVANFVEVGTDGLVHGIRFLHPDGSEHHARGRLYAIAAHGIETPKLLLISRQEATPNGVANFSDAVGRYLMDHPIQLSWALANEPLFPYRSPLENAGIEQFRDGSFRGERSAFRIAIGEDGWAFPGQPPIGYAGDLINEAPRMVGESLRGRALREELGRRVARQFRFAGLVEQLPQAENRVIPDFERRDAIGIPRPRLIYDLDEFTLRGMAAARAMHDRLFDAVGVSYREHADQHFGAGHIMGTYRMGTDPAASVVDPLQRSHDHPNLFLLGSGVFPTVGTANPTLTIAALALWAAETMRGDLERGVWEIASAPEATPATPEATPAATPAATPVAATEVTVEMVDIDFNPNEFSIPANTEVTVRLPNLGQIIHNFNVDPLDIQSGDVPPGGETTVTINAAVGDYEYYCSIPGHREAGMAGTVQVE